MSTEPEREFVGNGRYALDQILGKGGAGEVVLAYDISLTRWVAIKRIPATDAGIVREAGVLANFQHPNIVTVYDVFQEGGQILIVMEFVQGQTLEELAEAMSEETFRNFAAQCLEGLGAAHAKNIVHRDIKPGNIMLAQLPEGGCQVKLLDFGQSRLMEAPSLQTMDHSGAVVGSVYMMSPEQLNHEELDLRTDFYSLGCVFYQALTLQRPFTGKNAAKILSAHLNHEFQPLASIRPDLPQTLTAWVERMFSLNRNDRPASAQEALRNLRASHASPSQVQAPSVLTMGVNVAAPVLKAAPEVDLSAATMRVVLPLTKAKAPEPVAVAAAVPVSVAKVVKPASTGGPTKVYPSSSLRSPEPEPKPRFPLGIVAAAAAVILLAGGGWGVWNFFLKSPPVPVAPVAPDVNAVPKDKPLPPVKKELVPKSQQEAVQENVLKKYDTNKDGAVSFDEFRNLWSGQFDYLDRNHDGKLDRNEWRHPIFKDMDLDKSGVLEKQEWMRFRDWCFSTFMDADKDGKAVPGEWK